MQPQNAHSAAVDTVLIRDLAVSYHVGVPDAERAQAQRLLLTIEMARDFTQAAQADDHRHTIDYSAVCQRLLHFGEGRSWKLIETLATEIAQMVKTEFGADQVRVEVQKFIIPEARYVAVRVER